MNKVTLWVCALVALSAYLLSSFILPRDWFGQLVSLGLILFASATFLRNAVPSYRIFFLGERSMSPDDRDGEHGSYLGFLAITLITGGALYSSFYNISWIAQGMPDEWVSTWYSRLGGALQTAGFALFLIAPNIDRDGFEWKPGVWSLPFAGLVVILIWWSGYQYRANLDDPSNAKAFSCPAGSPIKGNIGRANSKTYHMPGGPYYGRTIPERCFATEQEARDAGFTG